MLRPALALVLLAFAGAAEAATLHWWRFEDSPGFIVDSVGGTILSAQGDAHLVSLPGTGRGGDFPIAFGALGLNHNAVDLDGLGDRLQTAIPPITGDFTVECFAHLDATQLGEQDVLVANATATVGVLSWVLQIRSDLQAGTSERELVLAVFGSGDGSIVQSDLIIDTGKDYYIAASFDLADPSEVTFYVQNLTDGGPLQIAVRPHAVTALNANTPLSIGAALFSPSITAFDGLIDEVRLSSHVLSQSELLINQAGTPIPAAPGVLPLLGLGLGAATVWRMRGRVSRT